MFKREVGAFFLADFLRTGTGGTFGREVVILGVLLFAAGGFLVLEVFVELLDVVGCSTVSLLTEELDAT